MSLADVQLIGPEATHIGDDAIILLREIFPKDSRDDAHFRLGVKTRDKGVELGGVEVNRVTAQCGSFDGNYDMAAFGWSETIAVDFFENTWHVEAIRNYVSLWDVSYDGTGKHEFAVGDKKIIPLYELYVKVPTGNSGKYIWRKYYRVFHEGPSAKAYKAEEYSPTSLTFRATRCPVQGKLFDYEADLKQAGTTLGNADLTVPGDDTDYYTITYDFGSIAACPATGYYVGYNFQPDGAPNDGVPNIVNSFTNNADGTGTFTLAFAYTAKMTGANDHYLYNPTAERPNTLPVT